MDEHIMYLRKSQMDKDFAEMSLEETLKRHKRILTDFCKERRIHVTVVLEEVVSGESLWERPQMLKALELVATGNFSGIVCMDIDRLSRGSGLDSGYITQILQVNNCKILTPYKTYDLRDESDEQFTDMKFMFSRYELKAITKRLVRGREQSASEGKFLGSKAPYGYEAYKLEGMKGNSLRVVPEQAKIVQMIFDMYTKRGIGYNTIAYELNKMHIPSPTGKWGQTSVLNILNNEVYLGKIRWGFQPSKKIVVDGKLSKKRVINQNYKLHEGLHEAIITEEQWLEVKKIQREKFIPPANIDRSLSNPFSGIIRCGKCGATIGRNVPAKKQNTAPWFRCRNRDCDCRTVKCNIVEDLVLKEMKRWLEQYTIKIDGEVEPPSNEYEEALKIVQKKLSELYDQQNNICDLLERGVYSIELFSKRNSALEKDIEKLKVDESDLLKMVEVQNTKEASKHIIIPTTQHLLDSYDHLMVEEKNMIWKEVLEKVTVYKSPAGDLEVLIYPKLPQ